MDVIVLCIECVGIATVSFVTALVWTYVIGIL
jgi:hypothetical protein